MLWVYGGLNESGPHRPFDYLLGPHFVELLGEDWEVWFSWRRCALKYEIVISGWFSLPCACGLRRKLSAAPALIPVLPSRKPALWNLCKTN